MANATKGKLLNGATNRFINVDVDEDIFIGRDNEAHNHNYKALFNPKHNIFYSYFYGEFKKIGSVEMLNDIIEYYTHADPDDINSYIELAKANNNMVETEEEYEYR